MGFSLRALLKFMQIIPQLDRRREKRETRARRRRLSSLAASFLAFALICGSVIYLTSCTLRAAVRPSILVIFVENLGFGSFSCGEEIGPATNSGFKAFCEESVRYTHAYTPSTLSQATLASVVTGLQPYEHGVRNNGLHGLSARHVTVGERALATGYHTSFFSGGPPIWRKSGLNQGFELFDDNVLLSPNRLYRPAREVVELFLSWQENEAPKGRFFTSLFFTDLQFVDAPTVNELGEIRESSYRSQLAEVDESLGQLVHALKERKIWENTHVFLVGTNGAVQDERGDEARPFNLYSEATRVTLLIKPARKLRESPFNWKIDANVGLADVGATLFDLLGEESRVSKLREGPARVVSLRGTLQGPQPDWEDDRLIVSESAWTAWRDLGGVRYALRKGPYLYLYEAPASVFNTFTDSFEASPLPESDQRFGELRNELHGFVKTLSPQPWRPPEALWLEKLKLGHELWRARRPNPETLAALKALSKKYSSDSELLGWRAIWALRLNDWNELKAVAGSPLVRADWAYVAARNLGERAEVPDHPCFEFLKPTQLSVPKSCTAEGLNSLLVWRNEEKASEARVRDQAMAAFLRSYAAKTIETRVAEANYVNGLTWDSVLDRLSGPDTIELILALPEMRRFRATALRHVEAALATARESR